MISEMALTESKKVYEEKIRTKSGPGSYDPLRESLGAYLIPFKEVANYHEGKDSRLDGLFRGEPIKSSLWKTRLYWPDCENVADKRFSRIVLQ